MKLSVFKSGFQELVNELRLFTISKIMGLKRALQAWRSVLLAGVIFLLCISPSFGQDNFTVDVGSVSRGTAITVSSNSPKPSFTDKNTVLTLIGENGNEKITVSQIFSDPQKTDPQKTAFEFIIPQDLALGEYNAKIDRVPDGQPEATPLESIPVVIAGSANKKLTINSELGELLPKIESVSPRVIFPNNNGSYSFKVIGSGFSTTGTDNNLIISTKNQDDTFSQVPEIKVCWEGNEKCKKSHPDWPEGTVHGTRQLDFANIKSNYLGELGIQIRVGEKVSDPPSPITLSRISYWGPALSALILVLILFIIFLVLPGGKWLLQLVKNINGQGQTNGQKNNLSVNINSFLIDQETKTYSLSRLQFYLWTLVAVFSYSYLFLSRSFAQGKLEFIDIPDGLPGIVLISAATTVFAVGISNTKGSKGSGPINPEFSDFFSAGGYIVPERLQFFVWTLVGVIVYLIVVIFQNPGQIQALPTIPSGFLQLSGISSLGYLGGKLARKPGPVISSMNPATYDESSKEFTLVINGRNLSKDATFKIQTFKIQKGSNDINLPKDDKDDIYLPKDVSVTPEIIDSEASDSSLAKVLKIVIPSNENNWPKVKSPYKLTTYNPDGQSAEWQFDGI